MSDTTTYSTAQINLLLAAGIDLNEFFGSALAVETVTVVREETYEVPAKKDGRNKAARAHNYAARIARRENTVLGGVTKAERRELAAILRAELGREFTKTEWEANMAAYKAGEFTLVDFS